MDLYKRCLVCKQYYKITDLELQNPFPCCPNNECKQAINHRIQIAINNRNISVENFNTYQYINGKIRNVCRVCGNISAFNHIYYCNQHTVWDLLHLYSWNIIRNDMIKNNFEKYHVSTCELCHKKVKYTELEVHHIVPVELITPKHYMSVWDKKNLICLCFECHRLKIHASLFKDEPIEDKKININNTLMKFIH